MSVQIMLHIDVLGDMEKDVAVSHARLVSFIIFIKQWCFLFKMPTNLEADPGERGKQMLDWILHSSLKLCSQNPTVAAL